MIDLNTLSIFLGIQFSQRDRCITMSQSVYLENVLKAFDMYDCKPRSTPCEQNLNSYSEANVNTDDTRRYRQMVGSLIYAMTCTRPDLAFVVTKLSQHLSCPDSGDWAMLKHVLQYVKKTSSFEMTFTEPPNDLRLHAFCDADWASSPSDRRSITGYFVRPNENGPPVSWKSNKQTSVAPKVQTHRHQIPLYT